MEVFRVRASLMVKSVVLSGQWAGQRRLLCLQQAAAGEGELAELRAELITLREQNRRLRAGNALLKARLGDLPRKKRHALMQRLQILWHMAHYGILRKRGKKHFCIARSTLYRWLHAAERGVLGEERSCQESSRKTPAQLSKMIWDIFEANPYFGRNRIAMTLWTLRVFVAASTVRNVLLRPKPGRTGPQAAAVRKREELPREILARYPNHVWSVDRTRVWRWRIWPTWTLLAVDHYSRMATTACPPEGPDAAWVVDALDDAFARHGPPKHIISDQEGVFTGAAFRELLSKWNVKPRFGAVGELDDFRFYYNAYRGHTTLGGALPTMIHRGERWSKPDKSARMLPGTVQRRVFADTGITAYRLAA